MKKILILLLSLLMLFAFTSCEEEEQPIGGDPFSRDMTLSVIRVTYRDEEKTFTTNARKQAILDTVNAVLKENYEENATPTEDGYLMQFVFIDEYADQNGEYFLAEDKLIDLKTNRAYPVTEEQYAELIAVLSLTPHPGQTL